MANDSNVLVRLKLLGGALFDRQAKSAGSSLRGIGTSGRAAGDGVGRGADRSTSALSRVQGASLRTHSAVRKLAAGAALAGRMLSRAGVAASALAATGLVYGIKTAATFEQSMANVQARLNLTKGAMEPLAGLALRMGAKTQFSAQQAADAMGVLASAGYGAHKIFKTLPGTLSLAAASGVDLADAASLQVTTLNAFHMSAGRANSVADALAMTVNKSAIDMSDLTASMKYIAPVAHATGQSFDDMMASVALMGNVGIKGEQAGTTLRQGLIRLVRPTKQVQAAFDTFHIKARELYGPKGLRPLPRILGVLSKHMRGHTEQEKKQALAMIFGTQSLSGMLALVDKGPGAIRKLSTAIQHSGGYAKKTAHTMRNTVAGAFDNFKGSVETAAITLTRKFMPAIKNALNSGASGINDFVKGLSTGETKTVHVKTVYDQAGRAHKVNMPVDASGAQKVGATVRKIGGAAIDWLGKTIPKVAKAVGDIVRQVLDALKPAMPFLKNVLLPLLKGVAEGIIGGVVAAFKVAVPIIKVLASVLGFVGKAAAPLKGVIEGIGKVIGFFFGGVILKLLGSVKKVGFVFRLLGAPIRFVGAAFRTAARIVGTLVGAFVRAHLWVARFVGTIGGAVGRVARAAVNLVGGIIHAIETLPGKAASFAGRAVSSIVRVLGSSVGAVFKGAAKLGKGIIDGIVSFIKGAPGAVISAVMSVLPGPIRSALGHVLGTVSDAKGIVGRAGGGIVRPGEVTLVGEQGPELARFRAGTHITPAGPTARMLGRRSAPVMAAAPQRFILENHNVVQLDGRDVHRSVTRHERAMVEAR